MAVDLRKAIVRAMVDKGLERKERLLATAQRIKPIPSQPRPEEVMVYKAHGQNHKVTARVVTTYDTNTPSACYEKKWSCYFECEELSILSQKLEVIERGESRGVLISVPPRKYYHMYDNNGKSGFGRGIMDPSEGIELLLEGH